MIRESKKPLWSLIGGCALTLVLIMPSVWAAGTIEFGENKSISLGAGLRIHLLKILLGVVMTPVILTCKAFVCT